ncbi:DEAD/DEAH box helicase family protein [Psychrobacter sp. 16-MNA-CIBAN-0192]|uniref:DEAD/DEAH box helicase n=2 Tax=unclassified Psychrobacter TaxID=196806 RepID=UPI003321C690
MILRSYQSSILTQIIASNTNDLVQLDTGAGKTPIIAKLAEHYEQAIIVCHRNILIKQASEKLAMCGLHHRIIASNTTKRISANNNIAKVGQHFINPRSTIELVSIDTINSQLKSGKLLINKNAKIMLIDEAHHLADDNKWAALAEKIGIRCVGFTATPIRGDGFPMIAKYGGFFERILQAEGYQINATERLISEGYLAEYSAYFAQAKYDSEKGESGGKRLYIGNTSVDAYINHANELQTICIEPRIINAADTAEAFKKAGISAEVIHSQIPQYEIERILQAFESKQIKVLVAVDMINEGFDVPDADVLILSRVVASFGLYRQLCGRVLRPRKGKHALILDLNGDSIARHGLPSDAVDWTKRQGRVKRKNLTTCEACGLFFKATLTACPACGYAHDIKLRGENTCSTIEKRLFDASMILRERQKIKEAEVRILRERETLKEQEEMARTYFEYSTTFQSGILGRRCKHFYDTLQSYLKQSLSAEDFNLFYRRYNSRMGNVDFYTKAITASFDSNKLAQCKKLYEVYR